MPPRASVMVRKRRDGREPGIGGLLKLPAPSHCLCPSFRSRSQSWTTPSSGSRFQNVVKAHPGWISSFCCAFIGYARAPRKRVVGINNNASIIIYDIIVMMAAKNKTAKVRNEPFCERGATTTAALTSRGFTAAATAATDCRFHSSRIDSSKTIIHIQFISHHH